MQCLIKSGYQHPDDKCILHPRDCNRGISFSIWEKVTYGEEVLNVRKVHNKQYIFSTGGDYDYVSERAYPGLTLYHQGIDLIAVVSTGEDVWALRVTGQLRNETWSNIGVRWEANDIYDIDWNDPGGLELYVNSEKVGHAVFPLERPRYGDPAAPAGNWLEARPLDPTDDTQYGWDGMAVDPPVLMVGCHRHSGDTGFRDFSGKTTIFDELTIWTRQLEINRTHDETLYFLGGYCECSEDLMKKNWIFFLGRVEHEKIVLFVFPQSPSLRA